MAISSIDTSDVIDSFLNDAANGTYNRHGVKGPKIFLANGLSAILNSATALQNGSSDTAADAADSYARDLAHGVLDRHGVTGRRIKHTVMNNGRNVNRII